MQTYKSQVSNNTQDMSTWEQGKQRIQEGLEVTKEKVGLKPTPKTDYGSVSRRDNWEEGKQRLQEGLQQGKERLQEGIDTTKEKMGLPTNEFVRDLQAQKKTLRHVEPRKREVFHDVKISSEKTGTEGFDVSHPTPEPNEGVISNLTQKVQGVFISAKQMVGMNNENTGRSSDKAGCEAFRSELWQAALKIQGPKLMDAEYSSGLWPVVTKQVKGAFNTTKGAFNTTAEWIKNRAPTTGTQDNKQQTSDDSKSIWVQGKEGIQSGIESAKGVLGLKPTPTVSPTDKAMENFGKEKPVDDVKDQQSEGVISKVTTQVTTQVQSAVNSAKEWVRVQSAPDPFDSSSKSILQQGKEGIQSGVEKAKDLMGIKPEVVPQKMSPEMQETIGHNQGVIIGSSEHI